MRRLSLLIAAVAVVLAATGCDSLREDVEAAGDSSPSPKPEVTFELQGVVVEASGSAAVTGSRQETARTPESPSPGSPTPQTSPTRTTAIIERAAPGSIALKLTSFDAGESPCGFGKGDVLVVSFTRSTTFQPLELTEARGFPNNLQGLTLDISGQVIGDECLLLATAVEVVEEGTDEPAREATPTSTTTATKPSPTPTR